MYQGSAAEKWVYKLLRRKPCPVRQGSKGPFIFIHINKTAGTSIGKAIGLPVKDHLTAREIIARVGRQRWDQAFKFTLVRNPWDKAVSLFEYRRKKNRTGIASKDIPFAEWVNMVYGPEKNPEFYNVKSFQPQVDWLKDDEGRISIDYIGKFESINADFDHIMRKIGIDTSLPYLNASKRSDYRSYYDNTSRDTVAQWFKEDIDTFDYEF
jgi:hypothetical protein